MKTIYIDMNGRLGNQFFQYAIARKIQLVNKSQLQIDFYNVVKKGIELHLEKDFIDYLAFFNVINYKPICENGFQLKIYGSNKQKRMLKFYYFLRKISIHFKKHRLLNRYQYIMQKNGIYKEDECNISFFKKYKSDIFLKGYFENPVFFKDIRNILLKELTPAYPPHPSNSELYNIIDKTESVCVSFRSWSEILTNKDEYDKRNVCTKEYYEKAIDMMHGLCPSAVFIVFSDDISFVKSKFTFKYETYFENGNDPVYEKLRLMYSCKHYIMSTSTFAWWAQYLSRNDNKIVISPDKWYSNNQKSYLLDSGWIKIKA